MLDKKLLALLPAALSAGCFFGDSYFGDAQESYPARRDAPDECYTASLAEACLAEEWEMDRASEQASITSYSPVGVQLYEMQLRSRRPIEYSHGEALDVVIFWDTTTETTELEIRLRSPEIAFWQTLRAWDSLPRHGPWLGVGDTAVTEEPEGRTVPIKIIDVLQDSFQYTHFRFFTDERQPQVQFTYNDVSQEPTRLQLPENTAFTLELDCRGNTQPEERCMFYGVLIEREEDF